MSDPRLPSTPNGWTVSGPGRDYDYSVFPATNAGAIEALRCAQDWLEERWDPMAPGDSVTVTLSYGTVDQDDLDGQEASR